MNAKAIGNKTSVFVEEHGEEIMIGVIIIIALIIVYKIVGGVSDLFGGAKDVANNLLGGITNKDQLESDATSAENALIGDNPFDPSLYLSNTSAPHVLDSVSAENFATQIMDATSVWSTFTHLDASSQIEGIIHSMFYQTQISQVANAFQQKYNEGLLGFIKDNVENTGFLSSVTGNNYDTYTSILTYAKNLPSGLEQ